jgi:Phage integrase, N-terminal SAM-like domain
VTQRKVGKKSSTLATDRGRIERHIKPLFGQLKVTAVTHEDIHAAMISDQVGDALVRSCTQCSDQSSLMPARRQSSAPSH